jgi:hydrogenase maturation protease
VTARILIASVGYRNLRDMSFGPLLIERLEQEPWPHGVEIEDLSYGPVSVMQSLDERGLYERIIFVAAVCRNRQPGGVYCSSWGHPQTDPEEVQACIAEALTGVISLDNLLIITTYFGKLPRDVIVIEVEPADDGWGEGLTPEVEGAVSKVLETIRHYLAKD